MPSSEGYTRSYRDEYDKYQGTAKQKRNRAKRNTARREYEKKHGDISSSTDIDHKTPLVKGGGNDLSNLRARSKSANRSFARTKKAGMK